jgi:hypothetical protein
MMGAPSWSRHHKGIRPKARLPQGRYIALMAAMGLEHQS